MPSFQQFIVDLESGEVRIDRPEKPPLGPPPIFTMTVAQVVEMGRRDIASRWVVDYLQERIPQSEYIIAEWDGDNMMVHASQPGNRHRGLRLYIGATELIDPAVQTFVGTFEKHYPPDGE